MSVEQILLRPSSIVRCLCLIGPRLQCLFPHRLPNSRTGNRQYKHRAREILSCPDSKLHNLNVNTQRHWLLILRKFVKLRAVTQAECWPTSRENNRFRSIYWRPHTKIRCILLTDQAMAFTDLFDIMSAESERDTTIKPVTL